MSRMTEPAMSRRTIAVVSRRSLAAVVAVLCLAANSPAADDERSVNGTTGTPLGGFGAGGVKFNANEGTFAAMTRPPADAYDFQKLSGGAFRLFVERDGRREAVDALKAAVVDGRPDDDAAWPTHRVRFAPVAGVEARLLAFSPFDRVDHLRASLPCVFYELALTNAGTSAATVAAALQWDVGDAPATLMPGKGFASATWAVYAAGAQVTAGNGDAFARDGTAGGPPGAGRNVTAVRVALAPGESKTVRFVLAWHNATDPEVSHYLGRFAGPGEAAEQALASFDAVRQSAVTLVDRMRASSLPAWLQNQTLNTLANLTTNSMYKRDGRVGFAEGQWTCFGTMDQMWHARQIVNQATPFFAWQELRYWARTQRRDGQIHHDFNAMEAPDKFARSVLVAWDDTEHKDYRKIDKWVDLNCAFIISVFETYRATGDKAQFDALWPNVRRAAQRVLDQVEQYGNKEYPYTFDASENSYDAGGDPNPYNASLSAVAYKLMVELAREQGEPELVATYQRAYDAVVESFRRRYLRTAVPLGKHCEGFFAGQWLALHLGIGEIWTAAETDSVLAQLNRWYAPYHRGLSNAKGTYDEWSPYVLTHYAGLLLNTRRAEEWRAMQHDAYARQYFDRNRVFNHPLDVLPKVETPKWVATDVRSKKQYISLPGLWRNYYDLVGYRRDRRTNTLWLKPILTREMNGRMTDALYLSPEGDGTVSCVESGERSQNVEITFKPDAPLEVATLRFADRFGASVSVTVNGQPRAFTRAGTGYAKELVVDWRATVGREGLKIVVAGDPGDAPPPPPAEPGEDMQAAFAAARTIDAFKSLRAASAGKSAGVEVVDGRVTSCNNFDYLQFGRVDFGKEGATAFVAKVKGLANDATIEIVLDSVSGESIGTCAVPNPQGEARWADIECAVKRTTGVRDVFLKFSGSSPDDLMHLDTIKFLRVPTAK